MRTLGTGHAVSAAPAAGFFARWADHDSWPLWSPDTQWVRLDGPAALGTTGRLKPVGAPAVRFAITAFAPAREYTDTSRLPGATLVFQHTAEEGVDGTRLGVRVTMAGPLTPLWARILGDGFQESAQADLDRLVALVEATTNPRAGDRHLGPSA
jgi:Polyketide cyclase / dehydrase and lipid transport